MNKQTSGHEEIEKYEKIKKILSFLIELEPKSDKALEILSNAVGSVITTATDNPHDSLALASLHQHVVLNCVMHVAEEKQGPEEDDPEPEDYFTL